jgi:hypothetical protein
MIEIEKIAGPLREFLAEREIIARCELLLATYDIVRSAKLSEEEERELVSQVGARIAPGIFSSIMSKEPIFFNLPVLDTYTQMNGRVFHFLHTRKYSQQDFANASSRFLRSIPVLRTMLIDCMTDRLKEFMSDAGYALLSQSGPSMIFSAEKRKAKAYALPSIRSLNIDDYRVENDVDRIILVPSSESLEPFIQFFRDKGELAEEKDLQIWIMNLEKGTIDPFIGYTTDLDIYNQFENPRLAEMVRNNWSRSGGQ